VQIHGCVFDCEHQLDVIVGLQLSKPSPLAKSVAIDLPASLWH
jgi:hypothetical protein